MSPFDSGLRTSRLFSQSLRSSLSSHHRTRHQPYLHLVREKVAGAEDEAGALREPTAGAPPSSQQPASPPLTERSRRPRYHRSIPAGSESPAGRALPSRLLTVGLSPFTLLPGPADPHPRSRPEPPYPRVRLRAGRAGARRAR